MGKVKHCVKIINIMECESIIRLTLSLWQHAAFLDFAAYAKWYQDEC